MIRGNAITLGVTNSGGGTPYAGPHTVSPAVFESTTLSTSGMTMSSDVTVEALPQVNSVLTQIMGNLVEDYIDITDVDYSITNLWGGAFQGVSNLTEVSLSRLASVSSRAFMGCTDLNTVMLPAVTTIGDGAFSGCTNLSSVSMPYVETVGSHAFDDCAYLRDLELPNATTIGEYAFANDEFINCVSLPRVRTIGAYAFYQAATSSPFLQIGSTLTTIGPHAFEAISPYDVYADYADVPFDNVTSIGEYAFNSRSFWDHDDISLPACEYIGSCAFYGAYMSSAVFTFGASSVCAIGLSALHSDIDVIYVPQSLYSAYMADQAWQQYSSYIRAAQ